MTTSPISATEFANQWKEAQDGSVRLIDVSSPAEFRSCHIAFAKNIPLDQLDAKRFAQERATEDRVYIVCRSGVRSNRACEQLSKFGFSNVVSIDGGMRACQQTELPIRVGAKAMSLERQVRIAAGSLILLGGLLAFLVHPYAIGLSMFVGAGLVFSGITDTCGMALVLVRLPWNR